MLCQTEADIPLFSMDWWLDCVCGEKNWEVLLIEKDEQIVAAFPFYMPQKGNIYMPAYTQTMGIWFNLGFEVENYTKELHRKQVVCKTLISQLPHFNYFSQNFDYSFTDWLPFHWEGFSQTTRYTYLLPDIKDAEYLQKRLSKNIVRNIQKAKNQSRLSVHENIPVELFIQINKKTFLRQNINPTALDNLRQLIEVSISRNQGTILGVFDEEKNLHAAVFIVWQNNRAYYIAGGSDPELRKSGAHIWALWEAILFTSSHAQSFNFEGSMIKGIEHIFREFGGIQVPYFHIHKGELSLYQRVLRKINTIIKTK